ncbi:gutamate synthase [NADPH] small chain [Sulfuriferula multivorans]|uniref:Gutamate synthase [NADPH] small chain n=1 Tax=Sulfuriferula multivorans TaxID=1559896 RepID=A0A401JCE1_9PROT|nr:FAD-dependent oxidoreductase [Sulfuriferula multivorans]GBL45267.1 gutamate synthase [NADPH] small chain [Sulfuriferula multivorans]
MKSFELKLPGFKYADIYEAERLPVLDELFLGFMTQRDSQLAAQFLAYRNGAETSAVAESGLLIDAGRCLEDFLVDAFGVEAARNGLRRQQLLDEPVHVFKEKFIKPRVRRKRAVTRSFEMLDDLLEQKLDTQDTTDRELAVARLWVSAAESGADDTLSLLEEWAYAAYNTPEGKANVAGWVSFKLPQKIEYMKLVPTAPVENDAAGRVGGLPERQRRRDGFGLTDPRFNLRETMDHVHYCVYCHDHEGDFCSRGFPDKENGGFRTNSLGVELTGCPLEERISEAHTLKLDAYTLAALAVIMIDNPLVPATGNRICNDCMKGCIYQKQDPVDIPQIETRILTDVLNWPWGFEIYYLLTRWNPLNRDRPYALPHHGTRILCVGAGPAGFNLSHHLLQSGFGVVAIDGLKIEPLDETWTGAGGQVPAPIEHVSDLNEPLDERVMSGFGGVAEYGITVRWDKNFLKLVYLTLARNRHFRVYGGVRFGGTMTIDDAWTLGFEHIALATGAGKPTVIQIKNNLAHGIRQASDFLMALQLTGASKKDSLANLQVRLPALVVGGGLSAIDTATEVQAYYVLQVEKMLERFEKLTLASRWGATLNKVEQEIFEEYLAHGRLIRAERRRATVANETPNFAPLLQAWGGVTVVYRRGMNESPAYLHNHEEIEKALQEGIFYAQGLDPAEAVLDEAGHVQGMMFRRLVEDPQGAWVDSGEQIELPARSVFVAAGSSPNTVYNREHPGEFEMDGKYFATHKQLTGETSLRRAASTGNCKSADIGFLTSYQKGEHRISIYGDNHPQFQGSVVKAMASGKQGAREITTLFAQRLQAPVDAATQAAWQGFVENLDSWLCPVVTQVERLGGNVMSVTVRARQAAQNWQPGQIYRLQNFHARAENLQGTVLQMEGMAIDGIDVDKQSGEIKLLVNEVGASSRIAAQLTPGEPVILMGPTGTGLPMPENQTVTVMGGHSAVTSTIDGSTAWHAAGNQIIFIGHFRNGQQAQAVQAVMEILSDQAIWILDEGPALHCKRSQDSCFTHGVDDYISACLETEGSYSNWLGHTDTLLLSDNPATMERMSGALRTTLRHLLKPQLKALVAVNSPMQCMMKEVCAQCLCQHHDPETKLPAGIVFSCFNQHQPLFAVDFVNLKARQGQNSVQEKVSNLWLSYLLDEKNRNAHECARVPVAEEAAQQRMEQRE